MSELYSAVRSDQRSFGAAWRGGDQQRLAIRAIVAVGDRRQETGDRLHSSYTSSIYMLHTK